LRVVSERSLPLDEPAEPLPVTPTLTLVGGTDGPPTPNTNPPLRG
jgi:hypothetical protein